MTVLLHEGFESGKWTHNVRIFPVGESPYDVEIGNVFTPEGWLFWFLHDSGTWDQPEARYCWKSADPRRIHGGEGAFLWFTFYRRHDAGLMRQIDVEQGTKLRFTAWAHAWSNSKGEGFPHPSDPRWSEGAGYDEVAWLQTEIPLPNGDPQSDAKENFRFILGIDPTGGTNPFADTVVWGEPKYIYNGHAQLSVEATADSDTITVFLRSRAIHPFRHNDAYWDDAELATVEDESPPPEERGSPRIQYNRTYVLLPPGAGHEWALAVVNATWHTHRYTLGGSADDAGIGDLDTRHVIVVNPNRWPSSIVDFFDKYYPDVVVQTISAETPERLRQMLAGDEEDIALSQHDPRWASKDLGEDPGGETIGDAGCLLTSLAICLRHAGRWIYPDELNDILAAAGVPFTDDDMLTNWPAATALFSDIFGDTIKTNVYYSPSELEGLLASDWEIILRHPGSTHFVYLESVGSDSLLRIIDPWDGKRKVGASSQYAGIRAVQRSGVSPPPPSDFPLRGVHDMVGGEWLADNDLSGWCTVAGYVGTSPRDFNLPDNNKVRYILRLSYSYATDDGGEGTMPSPDKLGAHEQAVIETMRLNPRAWGFIYGNEPNNPREWPRGHSLTPQYYMESYNRVWSQKPAGARLSPAALDPYNAGWGDWRETWRWVLNSISDCDFLAMHAYTHGPDPALILGKAMFGDEPLVGVYYDMRVLESQMAILPAQFQDRSVVVTEMNHWVKKDLSVGWEPDAGSWVRQAFSYLASRGVTGGCLFRHGYVQWKYGDLPNILEALKGVG